MRKLAILSALLVVVVYSCRKTDDTTTVQAIKLDLPTQPYNYDMGFGTMADSMNSVATLGRVLFYDGHLSVNNAISCGSCHKQAAGFADNVQFSTGFEGRKTGRNSPAITAEGISGGSLFWDGRENNIANLVMRPITNHVEMGIDNPEKLPAKLAALPYYEALFLKAFGDKNITVERISNAVALFMESMNARSTRFDRFINTGSNDFTADEQEGMSLFNTKYPCANCHNQSGGYFGGNSFRDIGLDAVVADRGRGAVTGDASDNGKFKTPSLHNVALSAPYMHDGRFNTLEEVLDHYSNGIQNTANLDPFLMDGGHAMKMNITEHDKKAIIAFLNTFTDFSLATDPKFSNPFKAK